MENYTCTMEYYLNQGFQIPLSMQINNIYFLILYVLVYSNCIILNIFLSVYFYFFPQAIGRGYFDWTPDCNIFTRCDCLKYCYWGMTLLLVFTLIESPFKHMNENCWKMNWDILLWLLNVLEFWLDIHCIPYINDSSKHSIIDLQCIL